MIYLILGGYPASLGLPIMHPLNPICTHWIIDSVPPSLIPTMARPLKKSDILQLIVALMVHRNWSTNRFEGGKIESIPPIIDSPSHGL